jgi:hypothetical protein
MYRILSNDNGITHRTTCCGRSVASQPFSESGSTFHANFCFDFVLEIIGMFPSKATPTEEKLRKPFAAWCC